MRVIEIETGITGYKDVVEFVRDNGEKRAPRGISTRDVGPVTVVMHNIDYALPLHVGRNASRKIAAAEAIQLIGAFSSPELLDFASPNFKQFAEPDGHYHGAYGRRIHNQLAQVIRKLRLDPDSRQAVITLWDPFLDNTPNKKDYPCTVMMHFAIIDARLELTVTMRSQDVWLGAPFDWAQFTQCQHTVARLLGVEPGTYRHITLSTHLYDRNLNDADKLVEPPHQSEWEWQPQGFGAPGESIHVVQNRARGLIDQVTQPQTRSERWYVEQFAGFQQPKAKAA